jgi:hypothetical protein
MSFPDSQRYVILYTNMPKYIKEGSAVSEVTFHFSKGGKNLGGNAKNVTSSL